MSAPDRLILRCAECGRPKPDDTLWARPAMACICGGTIWQTVVTFTNTHDGPVAHGDIQYGDTP